MNSIVLQTIFHAHQNIKWMPVLLAGPTAARGYETRYVIIEFAFEYLFGEKFSYLSFV